MTSLIGELSSDIDISCSAASFFAVICSTPSELATICPGIITSVELVDGTWGALGSTTTWNYLLSGEAKVAKVIIQALETSSSSYTLTYELIGGSLLTDFSSFTAKFDVTATQVYVTLNYVKLSLDVSTPQTTFDLAIQMLKLLDAYLTSQSA